MIPFIHSLKKIIFLFLTFIFSHSNSYSQTKTVVYSVFEKKFSSDAKHISGVQDIFQYYVYVTINTISDSTEYIVVSYSYSQDYYLLNRVWMPDTLKLMYNTKDGSLFVLDIDSLYNYSMKKCEEYIDSRRDEVRRWLADNALRPVRESYYEFILEDVGEIFSTNGKSKKYCIKCDNSNFFVNDYSYIYCLESCGMLEVRRFRRFNLFTDSKVYPKSKYSLIYPHQNRYFTENNSVYNGIVVEYDPEGICNKIEMTGHSFVKKIIKIDGVD